MHIDRIENCTDRWIVHHVQEGSQADELGVQYGWHIIRLNGKPIWHYDRREYDDDTISHKITFEYEELIDEVIIFYFTHDLSKT